MHMLSVIGHLTRKKLLKLLSAILVCTIKSSNIAHYLKEQIKAITYIYAYHIYISVNKIYLHVHVQTLHMYMQMYEYK